MSSSDGDRDRHREELLEEVDRERTPASGFHRYRWPLALVVVLAAMLVALVIVGLSYIT